MDVELGGVYIFAMQQKPQQSKAAKGPGGGQGRVGRNTGGRVETTAYWL